MDKQNAINYLRSSGYSDEQWRTIKIAFEKAVLCEIYDEIYKSVMNDTRTFTRDYYIACEYCLGIIQKYYRNEVSPYIKE